MKHFNLPPWGAPPPDNTVDELTRAIQAAVADVSGRSTEIKVADWNIGCDGFPIVSVGDGTDCHAAAAPGEPGAKKFLVSPLSAAAMGGGAGSLSGSGGAGNGGTSGLVVQVVPLVGRAFSGNEGYGFGTQQGGALSTDETLSGGGGGAAIPYTPTGDGNGVEESGRRLVIATDNDDVLVYVDPWDDGETPAVVTFSSLTSVDYVSLLTGGVYFAGDLNTSAYATFDAGGEIDSAAMDYPLYGAPIIVPDGGFAFNIQHRSAVQNYNYVQVIDGASDPSTVSLSTVDLGDNNDGQVYISRLVAVNPSGDVIVATTGKLAGGPGDCNAKLHFIRAPYTDVHSTFDLMGYGYTTGAGPYCVTCSPNGKWIAYWSEGAGSDIWLLYAADGRSYSTGSASSRVQSGKHVCGSYGGMVFGPDGRLFCVLREDGTNQIYLTVLKPDDNYTAAEHIDLGFASAGAVPEWISVSADMTLCAVGGFSLIDGTNLKLVLAPFTAAGATVKNRDLPAGRKVRYQFEFDRYMGLTPLAPGTVTITIGDPTSAIDSGNLVLSRTVTATNTSATDPAYAVLVELDLLAAEEFYNCTGSGVYDAGGHKVTWVIAEIPASNAVAVAATTKLK